MKAKKIIVKKVAIFRCIDRQRQFSIPEPDMLRYDGMYAFETDSSIVMLLNPQERRFTPTIARWESFWQRLIELATGPVTLNPHEWYTYIHDYKTGGLVRKLMSEEKTIEDSDIEYVFKGSINIMDYLDIRSTK